MKQVLLNCDQVFDVLTRGPFPTGSADDEGVEHHLRACHECRQLAEALRPAVDLLHETVPQDGAAELPTYQGSLPRWGQDAAQFAFAPENENLLQPASRLLALAYRRHSGCQAGVSSGLFGSEPGLFMKAGRVAEGSAAPLGC